MKSILIFGAMFLLSACTPIVKESNNQTIEITQPENSNNNYQIVDKKHNELLKRGETLIKKREYRRAIVECFNPIIQDYNNVYANSSNRIYTARTKEEYDFYAMSAINEGKAVKILSDNWSKAYFLKAYTLLELKELNLAKKNIRKALYLAPSNAKYLSELGHIQHIHKDFKRALKTYQLAEKSATLFSPKNLKKEEIIHAKIGIGYSYTELKEFNRAQNVYKEVLKLDSHNKIAMRELQYIKSLKY